MKVVGNSSYQKEANSLLILNSLRNQSYSRSELALKLGLQFSTMTYIVTRLIDSKMILEKNLKTKTNGRPPIMLSINPKYGNLLGIELLANTANISILDFSAKIIKQEIINFEDLKDKPEDSKERFNFLLDYVLSKVEGKKILGCCVAVPGIVSLDNCSVEECWTHNLKKINFNEDIKKYNFPIIFENDANACTQKYLEFYPRSSFIYVLTHFYDRKNIPEETSSIGIGYGLVIDGRLYKGAKSRAGEMRSVFSTTSEQNQVKIEKEKLNTLITNKELQKKVFIEILENLDFAADIFDPELIILGGEYVKHKDLVQEILNEKDFNYIHLFKIAEDGSFDTSDGAAYTIYNQMMQIPRVGDSYNNNSLYDSSKKRKKI